MSVSRWMRRLRLELDQTLRTRAFVSRAVRGMLTSSERLDLIAQLAFMLWSVGGEHSGHLIEVAGQDALNLGPCTQGPPPPCSAVHLLSGLNRLSSVELPAALDQAQLFDVLAAVAGTSWVINAAEAAAEIDTVRMEFLSELSQSGTRSLRRLDRAPPARDHLESLYAFAELSRGMVLGVTSYLDGAWPAPIHSPEIKNLAVPAGSKEVTE